MVEIDNKKLEVDAPLVTFVLVSYNQENYIEEAIKGALSQDFDSMEIIVSDDCSTDNTFGIVTEFLNQYSGSKRIIARKTRNNIGTFRHIFDAVACSKGKLIVLAAGDDISYPQRVSSIVEKWMQTGAWGLCSKYDRIDDSGNVYEQWDGESISVISRDHKLNDYFMDKKKNHNLILGATSAYDRRAFEFFEPLPQDFILSEDGVLSVLLNFLGKGISEIDRSLVKYRSHPDSLTNSQKYRNYSYSDACNDERRIELFANSQANRCSLFLRVINTTDPRIVKNKLDHKVIESELLRHRARADWRKMSMIQRFHFVFSTSLRSSDLRWAIPRLFSVRFFLLFKTLYNKIS